MPIKCPFPGCPGKLSSAYMLRRHFRDLHPKDSIEVWWEGHYPRCERCAMQCNPEYPRHINSQVCQTGAERRTQRDSAITSALALRQLFYVKGEVLEKVELFRYLGQILAQDDNDVRAVRNQIKKARGIWARVGQVLQGDNTPPKSAPSSTRQLCRRSSFMEARHGTSHRLHWRSWRGSTSKPPTVWLPNISLGKDQIIYGSTQPQKTSSRSVGCTLSRIISA